LHSSRDSVRRSVLYRKRQVYSGSMVEADF
jgi:hypothetical protein